MVLLDSGEVIPQVDKVIIAEMGFEGGGITISAGSRSGGVCVESGTEGSSMDQDGTKYGEGHGRRSR